MHICISIYYIVILYIKIKFNNFTYKNYCDYYIIWLIDLLKFTSSFHMFKVEWAMQGDLSQVEQLDLTWKCFHSNDISNNYEPTVERRILAIEECSANISVKNLRFKYTIYIYSHKYIYKT